MKNTVILTSGIFLATGIFSFQNQLLNDSELAQFKQSHRNNSGAPAGRTGAPGEVTCTACHAGSATTNSPKNDLTFADSDGNVVTSYFPDSTYTVTLTIDDPATRKGFQLVALAVNGNTQAGVMTASSQGGTNRVTSGGKQYINHTSASTGFTSGWTFTWKAPSATTGDVRFYIASNITNNNGTDSGDQIHLTQKTIQKDATASVFENEISFSAIKNSEDKITFISPEMEKISWVSVVNLEGKELASAQIQTVQNQVTLALNQKIENQLVIVRVRTATKWYSKKIQL